MAEMNINSLLDGEKPKLLDEWQVIPQLWDAVRFAIDHSKGIGQFIFHIIKQLQRWILHV